MKTISLDEAYKRSSGGPFHTDGDGLIYGPNPEYDGADMQQHDEILIADVAPDNVALTEYDPINAAILIHAFNVLPEIVDSLLDLLQSAGPENRNRAKERAVAILAKASTVEVPE